MWERIHQKEKLLSQKIQWTKRNANKQKKKDLVTAKHMKQAVINFTNKQLTDDQTFLLNLVQNLVPANKNTPFMDILT